MRHDFAWDDIAHRVSTGIFLPPGPSQPGPFSGTDQLQLLNENLKKQPANWFYRDNPIDYKLNLHGYRTVEFDTVDWANSIVVFGCSNVFGVGVHEEDTLSSQLSKLLNMPVINMGAGGTSMEFSLYNSIILRNSRPTPKLVVHIWSSLHRTAYYHKRNITHYGTWGMEMKDYMGLWSEEPSHALVHGTMCQMTSKLLWADKTQYYEASFFDDTSDKLKIPCISFLDKARDLMHPGRDTLGKLAKQIAASIT